MEQKESGNMVKERRNSVVNSNVHLGNLMTSTDTRLMQIHRATPPTRPILLLPLIQSLHVPS